MLAARLDGSVCVVAGCLLFAEDLAHAGGVKFFLGGLIDEGNGDVDGFFFCAGVKLVGGAGGIEEAELGFAALGLEVVTIDGDGEGAHGVVVVNVDEARDVAAVDGALYFFFKVGLESEQEFLLGFGGHLVGDGVVCDGCGDVFGLGGFLDLVVALCAEEGARQGDGDGTFGAFLSVAAATGAKADCEEKDEQ